MQTKFLLLKFALLKGLKMKVVLQVPLLVLMGLWMRGLQATCSRLPQLQALLGQALLLWQAPVTPAPPANIAFKTPSPPQPC